MLKDRFLSTAAWFLLPEKGAGDGTPPAEGDTSGTPPAGDGQPSAGQDDGSDQEASDAEGVGNEAAGDEEGEPEPSPAAAAPDWRDREIGRKHRQLQEAKREKDRIAQELADAQALLQRRADGGEGDPPARQPTAIDANNPAVREAAAQIVAKGDFDRQCNDAFTKGKAAYGDKWEGALARIGELGGFGDGDNSAAMMTNILATDEPAKVLFELGSNPDNYHRIMDLAPARRMAELVKLGLSEVKPKGKTKPKPSGAAAPVNGIGKRADAVDSGILYRDNTPDDKWYEVRQAQKRRRWEEKQGRQAAG